MGLIDLIQNNPRISIIIFAFIVTSIVTVITYLMTDQKRMKEIKEKQKILKAEIKKHKHNPDKMMQLNKEMVEDMPEQLKLSMKPLLITIIPLIIFFGWLRSTYAITVIASTWLCPLVWKETIQSPVDLMKIFFLMLLNTFPLESILSL